MTTDTTGIMMAARDEAYAAMAKMVTSINLLRRIGQNTMADSLRDAVAALSEECAAMDLVVEHLSRRSADR